MKKVKTLRETKRREKVMEKRDLLRLSKFRKYLKNALGKFKRNRKSKVKILNECGMVEDEEE